MFKRFLSFVLLSAVMLSAASAATWYWTSPYDDVTTYRYQLNSESGRWTYVDGRITSVDLDAPADSVLYVQLSLDGGRTWSPSGKAVYAGGETAVAGGSGVAEVGNDAAATSMPFEKKQAGRPFAFNTGLALGAEIVPESGVTDVNLLCSVNLDFENIASSGDVFGLDILVSGNMYLEPGAGSLLDMFINPQAGLEWYRWDAYRKRYSTDLMLGFDFLLDSTDINIALGGGVAFFKDPSTHPVLFTVQDYSANAYATASFSMDKYFGSVFHIGLGYKFKYSFAKQDILKNSEMTHDVALRLGLTF